MPTRTRMRRCRSLTNRATTRARTPSSSSRAASPTEPPGTPYLEVSSFMSSLDVKRNVPFVGESSGSVNSVFDAVRDELLVTCWFLQACRTSTIWRPTALRSRWNWDATNSHPLRTCLATGKRTVTRCTPSCGRCVAIGETKRVSLFCKSAALSRTILADAVSRFTSTRTCLHCCRVQVIRRKSQWTGELSCCWNNERIGHVLRHSELHRDATDLLSFGCWTFPVVSCFSDAHWDQGVRARSVGTWHSARSHPRRQRDRLD